MFTLEKKYHLGKQVFWYFFVFKNKALICALAVISVLAYLFLFGKFVATTEKLILGNVYFIDVGLLRLWAVLFVISFTIIILLRASVQYRTYSFIFHKHALHVSHGIFFIKEHVMPYSQIINVEIKKNITTIVFGLVELDIITGLTEDDVGITKKGKRVSLIPIIDTKIAKELSHKLMSLAAVHNGYEEKNITSKSYQINTQRRRRKRS